MIRPRLKTNLHGYDDHRDVARDEVASDFRSFLTCNFWYNGLVQGWANYGPQKAQENNFTLFSLLVVVIYLKNVITFIGVPTKKIW